MYRRQIFNTKIIIEKMDEKISNDNRWVPEYVAWEKMWASVSLKDVTAKRASYLFAVKLRRDFPIRFRVKIGDKIFIPTQSPIVDPANDSILFHAVMM